MWAKAAKAVSKYTEGVLTALDANGRPFSVRQTALAYDAASGELAVTIPAALEPAEGTANLLCHFHDENLWGMRMAALKGRIERRDGGWRFVTTAFKPPSAWEQITGMGRSGNAYLQKRGLPRPVVDFGAVDRLWERAAKTKR